MGLDRHDLHGSAISFELSFSDLFLLFCFLNYPSKLSREDKEIRSGGLWFSYKYLSVLQHTRNERNLSLERSYEERRALSGKLTITFSCKVFVTGFARVFNTQIFIEKWRT